MTSYQPLCQRILRDGDILPGGVLKVDSFLNHQIDVGLLNDLGREFARRYANEKVTKILTVEASGIGIACIAAQHFGVPVVFAKKHQTKNLSNDVYSVDVESFTHGKVYQIKVSKKYISPDDRILIIDDFLAMGNALIGLQALVEQAGATAVGAGIVIEKGFQPGGQKLRDAGLRVESLAIVENMDNGQIVFS